MDDEWLGMSAAALGRGIDAGAIDPRALAETFLAAIKVHPHRERIYARTTPDRARAEAAAAAVRARTGVRRGPLDGVPISWKDLFDSAGVATEAGSRFLEGRAPARDCALLARAARAGLVCLGKTHMTELAFSGLGVNPVTATPPNVHDAALAPGGSSSGAAASVAFGLAAAGIGSDTGGSVRAPAAWNDLVGLKITHGSLPMLGVVPLCPRFDTAGPLCRTVEDAALVWAAMAAAPTPDLAGATLAGARLLLLEEPGCEPRTSKAASALRVAVARFEAAGAQVKTGSLPAVGPALALSGTLFPVEAYATWGAEIERRPELMHPPVRERFRLGLDVPGTAYAAALAELERLRADYAGETAGFDAVMLATTPNPPPRIADMLADDARFSEENVLTLRNTRIANLLGLCALTLPTGTPAAGLMLCAAPGRERLLLRLAAAAERLLNG